MSKNEKLVKEITARDVDFSKWYTDVVRKARLADYAAVRGCMVIEPYGYAIWENIQSIVDKQLKATDHTNLYMPLLIPESLLNKEANHIEGFAPEVAWVTHGGNEKLAERLCIRPTSETLFCEYYKNVVQSYRDLPQLCNQWCSVVRWEKTSRPFLRSVEFLWQEGHTLHETKEDAMAETLNILDIYASTCENELAIPVIKGQKTESEKFAGAESTYTIEAMMHDGKALQSGTSHYFGQGFARTFDITFQGRDNTQQTPHQTSWGVSTRLLGAIIMTHGDDDGLVLPPAIAPIHIVIIPIASHKEGVNEKALALKQQLCEKYRVKLDRTENTPGWKFAEYEMKGVPLRLEIGPKDIEQNQCILVRRDTREKIIVSLDELEPTIDRLLTELRDNLYNRALKNRENKTFSATTFEQAKELIEAQNCFIKAMWCGDSVCEEKLKDDLGLSSRCIINPTQIIADTCICCGKPATQSVYWGKSY
ncbi:MAG: proline--tRNA ligase [Oscillospiraceae bacterium]